MDKRKRLELIKAMELIVSCASAEQVKDYWIINGVAPNADGTPEDKWLDYYTEDKVFGEVLTAFISTMRLAYLNGGLECDGVKLGK